MGVGGRLLHVTLPFRYGVYGVSLRSEIPLALPLSSHPGLAEIEIRTGTPVAFAQAIAGAQLQIPADWYHYAHLHDGSHYVRWAGLGEFLVSPDGALITCTRAPAAAPESFQVYLLNQAISFALVQQGFEPLHATTVIVDGEAIALLGDSGFGKSTLAASFLHAGHGLLTDDLLLLRHREGGMEAYPGPSRIKLFPKIARRFLSADAEGVPMNAVTSKQVIALGGASLSPVPLRAIYVLAAPHETRRRRSIQIQPLSPREAFLALVANTYNYRVVHAPRLQRQVSATAQLLRAVPVRKLSYPRLLARLPEVREAIIADMSHLTEPRPKGAVA
jgi:hypothetical protein